MAAYGRVATSCVHPHVNLETLYCWEMPVNSYANGNACERMRKVESKRYVEMNMNTEEKWPTQTKGDTKET